MLVYLEIINKSWLIYGRKKDEVSWDFVFLGFPIMFSLWIDLICLLKVHYALCAFLKNPPLFTHPYISLAFALISLLACSAGHCH